MLHSIILVLSHLAVVLAEYDKDTQQQLLDTNKSKWDAFVGSPDRAYTMKFRRDCFCLPEYRGPFDAVVELDKVVSATYSADSDMPGTPVEQDVLSVISTVYDAFDEIEKALDDKAADLTVSYDEKAGYPASVRIDWEAMIADEETDFSIDNIVLQDAEKIVTDDPSKAPSAAPFAIASIATESPTAAPVTAAPVTSAPVTAAPVTAVPAPVTGASSASPSVKSTNRLTTSPSAEPSSLEDASSSIRLTTSVLFSLFCIFANAMA